MWVKKLLPALLLGFAALSPLASEASAQRMEPTWANPQRGFQADQRRERRQDIISVREAADRVRSQVGGGEMLGASLEQNGDRPYYILVWRMPNGDRRDFRVDAVSGRVG